MKVYFVLFFLGALPASASGTGTSVDLIYQTPLHRGEPGTAYWVRFPSNTEIQVIGTPSQPAALVELADYPLSYRVGECQGGLGGVIDYAPASATVSLAGVAATYACPLLGGQLKGFAYLGIRPHTGSTEILSPNNRLLWPIRKECGLGLGSWVDIRSGQPTGFLLGPLVEWRRSEYVVRLRFGAYGAGKAKGQQQLRMDLMRIF